MKKIGLILGVASLIFAGCDAISGDKDKDKGFDYKSFGSLISNPGQATEFYKSDVEFVAMIISDRVTIEVDGEDPNDEYVAAAISRTDDYFYINVTDLEDDIEVFSVVTVKGKVWENYITTVVDNTQIDVLVINAESLKEKKTDDSKAVTDGTCQNIDKTVEYTFKEVAIGTDVFGSTVAVVYYDAKAIGDNGAANPNLSSIFVHQDGEYVLSNAFEPDIGIRGDALSPIALRLDKGDSKFLYKMYELVNSTADITFEGYDDEYNLTCSYTVPIN